MDLPPLTRGTLLRRYKRFLADVSLADGSVITAHCPNTGAMTGCAEPGSPVWLSRSANPQRKYPYGWELVATADGSLACIHSARANALAVEAIENRSVVELQGYCALRGEVKYGEENSRVDVLLEFDQGLCFVEVKSVTLHLGGGLGVFPDAVSERGTRHLRELIACRQQGHRAVLLFAVLHTGIQRVAPADAIDARYGGTFREALEAGVEVLAYGAAIDDETIVLHDSLPVLECQPD